MDGYFLRDEVTYISQEAVFVSMQLLYQKPLQPKTVLFPWKVTESGPKRCCSVSPAKGSIIAKGECPSLEARLLPGHTQLQGKFRNRIFMYRGLVLRWNSGLPVLKEGFRGKVSILCHSSLQPWVFFLTIFISFCRIYSHQKDEPENKLSQYGPVIFYSDKHINLMPTSVIAAVLRIDSEII